MKIKYCLLASWIFSGQVQANLVEQKFRQAFVNQTFVMPDNQHLQQLAKVFKQELKNQASLSDWQSLGFIRENKTPFVFLSESKTNTQGHGFISFRPDSKQNIFLQIPHAKSDLNTGQIGSYLFTEGDFKVALWNNLPRKQVDVAHHYQTSWQVLTQAFAESYPQGRIIQIHGFSASKRKTLNAKNVDIIISAGHEFPPLWIQNIATCLQQAGQKVALYPYNVTELGATTNTQGQLLRALGHQGFLHLEMNKNFREKLLKQADLRQLLLSCLAV